MLLTNEDVSDLMATVSVETHGSLDLAEFLQVCNFSFSRVRARRCFLIRTLYWPRIPLLVVLPVEALRDIFRDIQMFSSKGICAVFGAVLLLDNVRLSARSGNLHRRSDALIIRKVIFG